MVAISAERVRQSTTEDINRWIDLQTEARVQESAERPEAIGKRLRELDGEWDVERTLEANAASLALLGLALGRWSDRRFLALPAVVVGFLLQHAVQGWCPPLPILRRLGFRTRSEIERERAALKALRGDFDQVHEPPSMDPVTKARRALSAAKSN